MAAYAAVMSLMNLLERIQNHPRLLTTFDNKQIESVCSKLCFLQDFLECYSNGGTSREAEDLERQIASAAHEAEDVIEFHVVEVLECEIASVAHEDEDPIEFLHVVMVLESEIAAGAHEAGGLIESHDQIHDGSNLCGETRSSCFMVDLRRVIEEMDLIKEKALKFKAIMRFKDQLPTYSEPAASSSNRSVVVCDDELIQLMDWLTGQRSDRQIIPIVGMGGIGKTTLARNVYENLLIVQHFYIRAWATISQEYSVRKILLELLSCLSESERETSEYSEDQLGEKLYKSLLGRRYLIILDDIWSVEAWDEIKSFIPESYNRSRVVVTTRLSNMANHVGSLCLAKNLLDWERSWRLFCEKGFGQEGCPPELADIGKKIVKHCSGLPLSIVVIGGLLGKYRRREYWERIAEDINSTLNSREYEHCFNILSLSYNHLPVHLKPCFLYMGIFPEDRIISASRLVKLWVAEGFLKPNRSQILEEAAMDYLKDLVDRNLVFVLDWGRNGRIRICILHDLVRDLCLRIGTEEKFLCVAKPGDIPQGIDKERRVAFHDQIRVNHHPPLFDALHSTSLARSLIDKGGVRLFQCRLLRVMDVDISDPPQESIFKFVNLRYLSCTHNIILSSDYSLEFWIWRLPSSMPLLWNLQTIIIEGLLLKVVAPPEIWEMTQLRHFEASILFLPDPVSHERDGFVLQNLHTLREVENLRLSEEVCKRMPSVKKLHLKYSDLSMYWFFDQQCDLSMNCTDSSYYCLHNLGSLHELESLKISFSSCKNWNAVLQKLTYPSSLKKLTLQGCRLDWEDLTMIGSLHHLEVLKLEMGSIKGKEWGPLEGQFLRLKVLKIYYLDLVYWNADSSHFPVLENLSFYKLLELDEIPLSIGEIPTLRLICLHGCSISAAISAMKILQEQESLGNDDLKVRVYFWDEVKWQEFREEMEKESFISSNFQLERVRD